ncbi:Gfo/Idh/MocA family oxidoreductase [Roseibacterium sp. SDUM158017]|uniref:Gfo/Idh/MocA family protein n=1 Tax=Roseicyclus salinarum TaxID=3036773 RepID=UPI002415543C|nr:Gfo/Idh/MocA family oxidoreductase [Roseibacterium sp. SDUM158017]MDG4647453.1 Gfo/Idh/MocA family oxidoreductase [Roseibacterium sp. SDUM158017]
MKQDIVNWGVLGASGFARKIMAPAIHEARRSRLAAVATRDPARAAPFADFSPGIVVHDSYEALLADPGIDAVYIPLPNALHVEWTEKAARAGKAVLCEKPIGLTAGDVDRLIALREETGVFIAEAWMPAHHPQWLRAREIVTGGGIGRLHTVTGVFTYGLNEPGNVRNSADLAGGATRDIGVYPIGAFRFATGLEPDVTSAEAIWENGIDASTWVRARAGDVRFSFHVSMRTTKRQEMVFEGDEGWLVVEAPFNAGQYGQADLRLRREGGPDQIHRFPDARQYVNQVEAVAATLLDGAPYAMPLEQSRGTHAAVDAVFDRLGPPK